MARTRANPEVVETSLTGLGLLGTPIFNKGTAFPESERDTFSLHGLLPPQVGTLEQQVARRLKAFHAIAPANDQSHEAQFARYTFMRDLQDVNETLFYALITQNVAEMLPVVYTPSVGVGCERFSEIWRKPRGVFLSYPNMDRIERILGHPRYDGVRCIVVSDGERILGLGDQGAGGMGIPIGKLALYTALAGIHPLQCLPVFLDLGTDNIERITDPLYLGWKNERIRGAEYDAFVDRFVKVVKRRWPHVLLQWEDFAGANAGRLLTKYRDVLPSFNDDIQGTAAVAVATVLAAVNVTGIPLAEQRFVVFGFGSAGLGIAELLTQALMKAGLSQQEARERFWAVDKDGLLVEGLASLRAEQKAYARGRGDSFGESPTSENPDMGHPDSRETGLLEVVERVKPTVLIGVSGQPGAFTEEVVRAMARGVARPAILPLSNPTSKCEATPQDVIAWSDGRAIVGTGSPFAPVVYEDREIRIAQTNNSYIFPGLALGIVCSKAKRVSDGMMMAAAEALARLSPTRMDANGGLLPPLEDLRKVSVSVAVAVGRQAALEGLAGVKGESFVEALRASVWEPVYRPYKRR
jgi:malate dehydrogenase (oxaloacetate-decarboxylating)